MLLARNSWLRYGSACVILVILIFVAHEQGVWRNVHLAWPEGFSPSRLQTGMAKANDNTILQGIDTSKGSKMVVIGKIKKDDTTWVQRELPDWQSAIYTVDDPQAPLHTPMNKGRESMAYLTFLIENYDRLPETIVFQHSHHNGTVRAWHVEDNPGHNNAVTVQHLRLPYVQKLGYANLRCITIPGCQGEVQPLRDPPIVDLDAHGNVKYRIEKDMALILKYMFGEGVDVPAEIGAACCAQFAVTRERVRSREREVYERIRQWVMVTELSDYYSGRVMESLWHIIFGMPAIHCPSMQACNCNLYGIGCHE